MFLSTRNLLAGKITEAKIGSVTAVVKVRLDGGEQIVTASITKEAVERLDFAVGAAATVFVKSAEVMLGIEEGCPSHVAALDGDVALSLRPARLGFDKPRMTEHIVTWMWTETHVSPCARAWFVEEESNALTTIHFSGRIPNPHLTATPLNRSSTCLSTMRCWSRSPACWLGRSTPLPVVAP